MVVVLGMVRCVFPTLGTVTPVTALLADTVSIDTAAVAQLPVAEVAPVPNVAVHDSVAPLKPGVKSLFFNADGTPAKHRILSILAMLSLIRTMSSWSLPRSGALSL